MAKIAPERSIHDASKHKPIPTHSLPSATIVSGAPLILLLPLFSHLFLPPHRQYAIAPSVAQGRARKPSIQTNVLLLAHSLDSTFVGRMAGADAGDLPQGLMGRASSSLCMYSSRFGAWVSRFTEEGDRHKLTIIGRLTNSLRRTWEVFRGISCHCCFFAISSLPQVIVGFDHSFKRPKPRS